MQTGHRNPATRTAMGVWAFAGLAALAACAPDTTPQDSETADSNAIAPPSVLPASPEVGGNPVTVARVESVPTARASLRPTMGNMTSGVVEFTETPAGTLAVSVELAELTEGSHGLHIHETGDCSAPDASSAGEHFNPGGGTHGSPNDEIHHAGDLGNVSADARGIAVTNLETSELQLDGDHGVVNRAIIVHSGEDDFQSQPSGNSGDPVACGVIRLTGAADSVG
jgi:Cu-Zn family superoxide dismutase